MELNVKHYNFSEPVRCQAAGQFMRLPADRCMYQVCLQTLSPGSAVPQYVPQPVSCPPGSCVPDSYTVGYNMPCTEWDQSCLGEECIFTTFWGGGKASFSRVYSYYGSSIIVSSI